MPRLVRWTTKREFGVAIVGSNAHTVCIRAGIYHGTQAHALCHGGSAAVSSNARGMAHPVLDNRGPNCGRAALRSCHDQGLRCQPMSRTTGFGRFLPLFQASACPTPRHARRATPPIYCMTGSRQFRGLHQLALPSPTSRHRTYGGGWLRSRRP
jgi:hypothetical protein